MIGEIQGSAAPKIAGEVVKSSWLRIQSVNRVFGLTLTLCPAGHKVFQQSSYGNSA